MNVFVAARDPELLNRFEDFLLAGGHQASTCQNLTEARALLKMRDVQVAILCHDLAVDSAVLLGACLQIQSPRPRVVAIVPLGDGERVEKLERVGVLRTLETPVSPAKALETALAPEEADPRLTTYADVSDAEITALEALHEHSPSSGGIKWLLGFGYYRAHRYQDAGTLLAEVVAEEPFNAQAHYYLGACEFRQGRAETARKTWKRALELAEGTALAAKIQEHLDRVQG